MFYNNERGSSLTVEYVLTLLVALSLLGGVSIAVSGIDERQEAQIVEDQLEVAGNEIAVQLEHQHMLLQRTQQAQPLVDEVSSHGELTFDSTYYVDTPDRIASGTYSAQISGDGTAVVLSPGGNLPTVEVPLRPEIPVRELSGAPGDSVAIVYDKSEDEFVLQSSEVGGS